MPYSDALGRLRRALCRFERATGFVIGPVARLPKDETDSFHFETLFFEEMCGNARIDPAAHSYDYLAHLLL
jgi:hypothetical protein